MNCKECNSEFESHGNSRYCPEKNGKKNHCYTQAKLKRQKIRLKAEKKDIAEESHINGYLKGLMSGRKKVIIPTDNILAKYVTDKKIIPVVINRVSFFKIGIYQIANYESTEGNKIQITTLNNPNEYTI